MENIELVVAAIAAGVGSILTLVFNFLLKWRKQQAEEKEAEAEGEAVAGGNPGSNPGAREGPQDLGSDLSEVLGTGRFQALKTIDWVKLQEHVAELASQQPVTHAQFDEGLGGVKKSVEDVRGEVQEVRKEVRQFKDDISGQVASVETKLDKHIEENGHHAKRIRLPAAASLK